MMIFNNISTKLEVRLIMQRASISKAWIRSMQVMNNGRYSSTAAEHSIKAQRQHGDSEFVKRRRAYEKRMHRLRISFASEHDEAESRMEQARNLDRQSLEGVAEARESRKREKSIARQVEHLARLEAVQAQKRERTDYKRRDWEERWEQVIKGRIAIADLLAKHASEWVTDETIEDHVERVIDEFFLEGAQQKQELKETVETV